MTLDRLWGTLMVDVGEEEVFHFRIGGGYARDLMNDICKINEDQSERPLLEELYASLWSTFNDLDCH